MATPVIKFPAREQDVELVNATSYNGIVSALDTKAPISVFADMLRAGVPHVMSVKVTVLDAPAAASFMVVNYKPTPLKLNEQVVAADSYTPDGTPLKIELVNVTRARLIIYVDAYEDIPERPEPWQTLALEVFAPLPSDAFTWDRSRWDQAVLDNPPPTPNTLFWDKGYWDAQAWHTPQNSSAWQNIIGPVTRLNIQRGVNALGPCFTAQTGTLSIEALNGLDPRALGVIAGAPVRLYDWISREPIFTGALSEAKTSRLKHGGYTATWQVVDKVSYLAATQRYGAIPAGGKLEGFDARINRLMKSDYSGSYDNARYQLEGSAQARSTSYGPTVMETSLAAHIDAAVTTAGGYWCCKRNNTLTISADAPSLDAPRLTLSDDLDSAPSDWFYTEAVNDWNTSAIVTSIEVTNHSAALDDKGEWRAHDQTARITSPTWTAAYGGTSVRADMTAPNIETAKKTAQRLLRDINRSPSLTAAGLPLFTRPHQILAATLDPVDAVKTISQGEQGLAAITSIHHEITPEQWRLKLTLQPSKTNEDMQ